MNSQENNVNGAEDVIASSAEEAAVAEISAASSLGGVACDAPNPPGVPSPAAAAAAAAAKKKMVSSANSATPLIKLSPRSRAAIPAPAIRLGPRVTPAIRKHGLQHAGLSSGSSANASPVKPRKLDTALAKKGPASKAVQQSQKPAKQEECPTTPPVQKIPPPSSFLACKISPLTSSAWKNGEKGKRNTVSMGMPPLHASSNLNSNGLSPDLFLSPRTPKQLAHSEKNTKKLGTTPRSTPRLSPMNFASDFGKINKKEGNMNALDATSVIACLQSPGYQGIFTPGGGLNSLSVTNTPRGMYGFCDTPGNKTPGGDGSGQFKLAPSLCNKYPLSLSGLEEGGNAGVNTPKVPPSTQCSMIRISPFAPKELGKKKQGRDAGAGVPGSPINFSHVFDTPRLPTPRLSRMGGGAPAKGIAGKNKNSISSSRALASPVASSALHTAEQDINLDDDLNYLLQLAGTTTPTNLTPMMTDNIRRVTHNGEMVRNGAPPSSLQLPLISSSMLDKAVPPQNKMSRNSGFGCSNISPPNLAMQSSHLSGVIDSVSSAKSSLKKKPKKRKSLTNSGLLDEQHQLQMESSHPNMVRHHHTHVTGPPPGHAGYYPNPGFVHNPGSPHVPMHPMAYPPVGHCLPQQHFAFSDRSGSSTSPSVVKFAYLEEKEVSPAKLLRKSKSSHQNKVFSSAQSTTKTLKKACPRSTVKRVRKSSPKASCATSKHKNANSNSADKERITAAIYAVNAMYGNGTEKDKKLAAVTLRGVTMRPSGKWQAQLYYSGKSRYIGVFDSKEKASLAYEIAREVLKTDKGEEGPLNAEETDRNVTLAREAAVAGVS